MSNYKEWVQENYEKENCFKPTHYEGDEDKCDGCWKHIEGEVYICAGGCNRENASEDDFGNTWFTESPQEFCLDCYEKKLVESSEGYRVCEMCALFFDECRKCKKLIGDEFTWFGEKKYALGDECKYCWEDYKSFGQDLMSNTHCYDMVIKTSD